jgi:acyl-CoA synthetase (AMP-forming)/AMP-acid ligase II
MFLLNADELQVDAVSGETRTYADIMSAALSVAQFLYSRGIRSGDVIGICSENSLDFILPVIGTYFTGATCAPLNPNYTLRKQQ